jgi:hypothetical protein
MKSTLLLIVLSVAILVCRCLSPVGLNPISPAQLTKGKTTLYEFSFLLDQSVSTMATINIGFPAEFNYTILASQLVCYYRTNDTSWITYSCYLQK